MKAERKKEIRSLIHTVPVLIKAHLVNQAFETEKVIAATFDLSEPFIEIMGGKIPQNHIEKIQNSYSDILYKAFNIGIKSGEIKSKSTEVDTSLQGAELDHELDIKMPMYFGIKTDLLSLFREQTGSVLESVSDVKDNLNIQFEKDLENAYRDGVKEYLSLNTPEITSPVKREEDEESLDDETLDDEIEDDDSEIEEVAEEDEEDRIAELEDELDEAEDEESKLEDEIKEDVDDEDDEEEVTHATVVGSLDATAVTAFKVWEKYASSELKELFLAQADSCKHYENARMVYAFNNWLVQGNKAEFYIPFESNKISNAVDKSVIQRLEKYAKLLKNSTAEKVLRYTLGLPTGKKVHAASDKKEKTEKNDKAEKTEKPATDGSIISKLEAYTKLLKDPLAEKVLRYTLGLPIKKVSASVQKLVGPYEIEALRDKIIASIKSHNVVEESIDDYQTIIVDCVLANLEKMPKETALEKLGNVLDIKASSFFQFNNKADVLAQKLDDALQLPGDTVFVNIDGDYCLTYNIKANDLNRIKGRTRITKLDNGDLNQIECLSKLSKSKTIRDINKASSKVATYLKNVLSDIKWGKVGIVEGTSRLNANLEDVIAEVFGPKGIEYYRSLRSGK